MRFCSWAISTRRSGSDPDGIQNVATTCGLIDLMSCRHSSTPPATYARGRTRLDYVLATSHVVNALSKSGYEPFNSRFPSDHRAYFLDFDTQAIVRNRDASTRESTPIAFCAPIMWLKPRSISKTKYDLLLQHNAFARGDQLSQPGDKHEFAERLDRDVVSASLAAEQQDEEVWFPCMVHRLG